MRVHQNRPLNSVYPHRYTYHVQKGFREVFQSVILTDPLEFTDEASTEVGDGDIAMEDVDGNGGSDTELDEDELPAVSASSMKPASHAAENEGLLTPKASAQTLSSGTDGRSKTPLKASAVTNQPTTGKRKHQEDQEHEVTRSPPRGKGSRRKPLSKSFSLPHNVFTTVEQDHTPPKNTVKKQRLDPLEEGA